MNMYGSLKKTTLFRVTIIEIRPFRNGWKCFEASGFEAAFLDQEQAIEQVRSHNVGRIRKLFERFLQQP